MKQRLSHEAHDLIHTEVSKYVEAKYAQRKQELKQRADEATQRWTTLLAQAKTAFEAQLKAISKTVKYDYEPYSIEDCVPRVSFHNIDPDRCLPEVKEYNDFIQALRYEKREKAFLIIDTLEAELTREQILKTIKSTLESC